ncbi:YchJ family protein [Cupriavidus sp. AU9028]|uniref:YchJ family protein n=1 Tax=Cupriavidus sp. AU9028 TaxID=2871157 RepID=UPI001C979B2B|nr:YchJ family metal-binding protein [Cupriavidus sp. AU9028]MBY4896723.1 hypothetical protein [Cupriavidus sp. AU9028]
MSKPSPAGAGAGNPCPCGAGSYDSCCGPFHRGEGWPASAEQLMRSRYSAYVLGDGSWLRRTWHPSTCPDGLEQDIANESAPGAPRVQWLGLTVRGKAQQDEDHAEVEFVARYKVNGKATRMHERSRFVREPAAPGEAPRWLYLDGQMLGEQR